MSKEIKFKCECGCIEVEQVGNVDTVYNKISNIELDDDNHSSCDIGNTVLDGGVVTHFQCFECGKEIGSEITSLDDLIEYLLIL